MMDIRPIRSEVEYDAALARIARFFESEPAPGTAEADEFDLLALVIADYESKHWAIEPPDPIDAVVAHMERQGLTQKDLANLLGDSRASEVLGRRRPLTMKTARKLHDQWHIPAESLLRPYELVHAGDKPRARGRKPGVKHPDSTRVDRAAAGNKSTRREAGERHRR